MRLDPVRCYRALTSRDARFDGTFFAGVVTTGIYCRPVCPAVAPRPENVRYFACAAAAEAEGFRPCRRCRPETAPGTPAWNGTSTTVVRALALIGEGALDSGGVEALASRLGMGGRHLRRLFVAELGATPRAIAQGRRLAFARKLIDETTLPMTEAAFAAGFSSSRRFNSAVLAATGRSPSRLRREAAGVAAPRGQLCLRLPFRPPYAWTALTDFLRPRATEGVEHVTAESYRRTVALGERSGSIHVTPAAAGNHLVLRLELPSFGSLRQVVERVRRLFDLGADPAAVAVHLGREPLLGRALTACPGIRIPGAWDGFELAVRAILGQQVTVKGATRLAGRLVQRYGRRVEASPDPGLTHLFPTPARLARAPSERIGMPQMRGEAIRGLARAVLSGELVLEASADVDETVARLRSIQGVGDWTAHYVALRALGAPDAFPAGDLGLRQALAEDGRLPSARELRDHAEAWRPWRGYAAFWLWRQLSTEPAAKE